MRNKFGKLRQILVFKAIVSSNCELKSAGCLSSLTSNEAGMFNIESNGDVEMTRDESAGYEIDICL